ncbi:unnamed protein product [Ectocarpus sp. CCAP 1310/34]|nr:unnamed protein product [Ectocarpus sp. CCAP 1310/34]
MLAYNIFELVADTSSSQGSTEGDNGVEATGTGVRSGAGGGEEGEQTSDGEDGDVGGGEDGDFGDGEGDMDEEGAGDEGGNGEDYDTTPRTGNVKGKRKGKQNGKEKAKGQEKDIEGTVVKTRQASRRKSTGHGGLLLTPATVEDVEECILLDMDRDEQAAIDLRRRAKLVLLNVGAFQGCKADDDRLADLIYNVRHSMICPRGTMAICGGVALGAFFTVNVGVDLTLVFCVPSLLSPAPYTNILHRIPRAQNFVVHEEYSLLDMDRDEQAAIDLRRRAKLVLLNVGAFQGCKADDDRLADLIYNVRHSMICPRGTMAFLVPHPWFENGHHLQAALTAKGMRVVIEENMLTLVYSSTGAGRPASAANGHLKFSQDAVMLVHLTSFSSSNSPTDGFTVNEKVQV